MKTKRLVVFAAVVAAVGWGAYFLCRQAMPQEGDRAVAQKGPAQIAAVSAAVPSAARAAVEPFVLATNQTASVRGTKPFVLKSVAPFQKSLRLVAESLGARTVGVLSSNAILVEATPTVRAKLAADRRFSGIEEFLPAAKVQSRLLAMLKGGVESVDVTVVTLAPADRQLVLDRVAAAGGEVLTGVLNGDDSFVAHVRAELVASLASEGDVRWMEQYVRPEFTNDCAVKPGAMNILSVWKSDENPNGLSGAGEVISTSDSGIDWDNENNCPVHPDLANQVIARRRTTNSYDGDKLGHGTHTAGSIVGDGTLATNLGSYIRGTAWGAKLYAWFCGTADNLVEMPSSVSELFVPNQYGEEYPIHIHSASWGSKTAGAYTEQCSSIDKYVWTHPDFLPVFSAGNEGSGRTTIGSPASAKNVLTVGATQNQRQGRFPPGNKGWPSGYPTETAEFSSRGPCVDGRIKPDVAAPGVGVASTRSFNAEAEYGYGFYPAYTYLEQAAYAYDCGTSMACPLTAGSVALIREWLTTRGDNFANVDDREYTNDVPTAALMKAVITGGAKDAPVPNNDQGWGRVDIAQTLFPTNGNAIKLVDQIPFAEGEEFAWVIETTNEAPLDVQLVWIDPPKTGSLESGPALINDLDLTVESLTGDEEYGYVFAYGNGGDEPDTLNNVESVHIADAKPRRYLIGISCARILNDYTEGGAAALYIRGAFDKDAEKIPFGRVRIRETGNLYLSLGNAVRAAEDGQTIEILTAQKLRKDCTITNAVTLTATNENPRASLLTPVNGAKLIITNDLTVTLTNIAFPIPDPPETTVLVHSNSTIAVGGICDLGQVKTLDQTGIKLISALESGIVVDCPPFCRMAGDAFGTLEPGLEGSAWKFGCLQDEELGGVADGTLLKWGLGIPVPEELGRVWTEEEDGSTNFYKNLDKGFLFSPTAKRAVIYRNTTFTNLYRIARKLEIAGKAASGNVVTLPPDVKAERMKKGWTNGFELVSGADLYLTNVVFTAEPSTGNRHCLFTVNGGALEIGPETIIENMVGPIDTTMMRSPVVSVLKGSAKLDPGAAIRDCKAVGTKSPSGGGAFYLSKADCRLDLAGGVVTNCYSEVYGGAVYVGSGAEVGVSGPAQLIGNGSKNFATGDDVYFTVTGSSEPKLTLADSAEGATIGVRFTTSGNVTDYAAEGQRFATVSAASDDAQALTNVAASVINLKNANLTSVPTEDGTGLVWADIPVIPYSPLPVDEWESEKAAVRVIDGGVTSVWDSADGAFSVADKDGVIVELLKDVSFSNDVTIQHAITLRSASGSFTLARDVANASVYILPGGVLVATNVAFTGKGKPSAKALFSVAGGELDFTDCTATGVYGSNLGNRAVSAVLVYDDGVFRMDGESEIFGCSNDYVNEGNNTGVGAGLLVDKGTAYLYGGTISGNEAHHASGVFIGNEGEVHFGDNMRIVENYVYDEWLMPHNSNLLRSDLSPLWLDRPLATSASIGYAEGIGADSNVFGRISADYDGSDNSKVRSASYFFRDDDPSVTGRVVTNATEELLVWSTAIADGVFVDKDGKTYGELVKSGLIEVPVPKAVAGLVYTGNVQTGVVEAVGCTMTGNVATNAGSYTATATLDDPDVYVWSDGTSSEKTTSWSIGKATYDMSGVVFEDATFIYDGTPKSIYVDETTLPAGVTVTQYYGNEKVDPSWYEVRAKFKGDEVNYEKVYDMVAHITIDYAKIEIPQAIEGLVYNGKPQTGVVESVGYTLTGNVATEAGTYTATATLSTGYCWSDNVRLPKTIEWSIAENPTPPGPTPTPGWTVVTNHPTPIAFKSIDRVSDTEWALVVTNRVRYCNYRLLWTTDLTQGFVSTGDWEHVVNENCEIWATNVITSGGAWFWRAEGADGTNMVFTTEE